MNQTYFFLTVILVYQALLFAVMAAVGWWLKPYWQRFSRRNTLLLLWLALNGVLAASMLRLGPLGFKSGSIVVVLVLYAAFTAVLALTAYALLRLLRRPAVQAARWVRIGAPLLFVGWLGLGWWSAYSPQVVRYDLSVSKPLAQPLKIALVSDLHLGQWVGKRQLHKLADIMAQEQPDIILIAGDVMDDVPDVYRQQNMQAAFARLQAPLGVYATLGNHDNYGGVQGDIVHDIRAAGVVPLRDEVRNVHNRLWLVGRRDDVEAGRRPLSALMNDTLRQSPLPVVVIDHQPTEALRNSREAIDLQVSGHTHRGQVWPATWLVRRFQTYDYGHFELNGRHLVVSSGYGLWGVPLRIGTRAEVAMITLHNP